MAKTIHNAAGRGNIKGIQSFLEKGASIDERDGNGLTPLFVAAYWNQNETVEWLCENGADIFAKTEDGKNLLMQAADGGNDQAVHYLLSKGVPVSEKDHDDATVLEFCAWHCSPETVSIVLNEHNWNSEELYHAAYCAIGNTDIVSGITKGCTIFKLLNRYAEESGQKIDINKKIFERANEIGHKEIISVL